MNILINLYNTTLVFQMLVQVRIKVNVGKISKINQHAGWNKAIYVEIFEMS